MENNCMCCNALQKFYSALKNLNNFSCNNDVLDNISALDCFFSEFRNITFVLQKDFSDNNLRDKYEELSLKYLKNEEMKWFVNKRNNITKCSPIKLEKNILIEVYLPNDRIIIDDKSLEIDIDSNFEITKKTIKDFIITKLGMKDLFFSTKIIFKENGESKELIQTIKNGIETMNSFMKEIVTFNNFHCENCDILFSKIKQLYEQIVFNEVLFIHDYYLEKDKIQSVDTDVQVYFNDTFNINKISDITTPINTDIFGHTKDLNELFRKYTKLHLSIFSLNDKNIIPNFMIIYNNFTFQIIPIFAESKTTIYRKIYEIVDTIDFTKILSIFYCSEFYEYDYSDFENLNNLEYSDRQKKAINNNLIFYSVSNNCNVKQYIFNSKKIDDINYLVNILNSDANYLDINNQTMFFLNPIMKKFKELYHSDT